MLCIQWYGILGGLWNVHIFPHLQMPLSSTDIPNYHCQVSDLVIFQQILHVTPIPYRALHWCCDDDAPIFKNPDVLGPR